MNFEFQKCKKCSTESLQGIKSSSEIEDGCYFCRLCFEHLCVEHLCSHMQSSYRGEDYSRYVNEEFERVSEDQIYENGDSDFGISMAQSRDSSKFSVQSSSESDLKKRLASLMTEAKLISRELERRAIDCSRANHEAKKKEIKYTSELLNAIEFIKKQIKGGISIDNIRQRL